MSDLISRSELIKALNEAQVEFDEYYKGLGKAKVITDNAPTVKPCENCDLYFKAMTKEEMKNDVR